MREKVTNFLLKKKKEKRKTLHCLNKRLSQHPLIYMYRSIDEKKVNITKKKHILLCYCLFIDFLAYYENLTTKSKLNWRLNNSSVNAEMCVFWSICTKRTCSGLWLKSLRAQRVLTKTQTQKIVFTFLCRYKWSKWLKSSWMVNFRDWHEVNFSICGY